MMKKWIIILIAGILWCACTQNPGGNKGIYSVDEIEHAAQKGAH